VFHSTARLCYLVGFAIFKAAGVLPVIVMVFNVENKTVAVKTTGS